MPTKEAKTKLIVDLPTELKQHFQIWCIKNNRSMTEIVDELVKDFMKDKPKYDEVG